MGRRTIMAIVLLHWLAGGVHGLAHAAIPVPLPAAKDAFVAVTVVALPLAGLVVLRWRRWGAWLIGAGMLGALVFGLLHHFVWPGPDHVAQVAGPWARTFRVSAVLLAATETLGIAAPWLARSRHTQSR